MTYSGNSPIIGTGQATAAQIDRFFEVKGRQLAPRYAPNRSYEPAPVGLGRMIIDTARHWPDQTVNHDLLASQIVKEAAAWQSEYSRHRNNPSGLGAVNNNPDNAIWFDTPEHGIRATVAHLLSYAVGHGPWTDFDPRFEAMPESSLGVAQTISGLDGRWAFPGQGYGQGIATLANQLLETEAEGDDVPNSIIQADNIYGVPFRVSIIPEGNPNRTNDVSGEVRPPVIHETANTREGANAEMHRRFVHNGGGAENVNFHFVVDDSEIIQLVPLYERGIHAGNAACNRSRPGIELCVNSDGDFEKTLEHGAKLCAFLGEYDNRMSGHPVQHFHCSGKNCPATIRRDDRWDEFLRMIEAVDGSVPDEPGLEDDIEFHTGHTLTGAMAGFYRIAESVGIHWSAIGVPTGDMYETVIDGEPALVQATDTNWIVFKPSNGETRMATKLQQEQIHDGLTDAESRLIEIGKLADDIKAVIARA